jgi:hypothetical protein
MASELRGFFQTASNNQSGFTNSLANDLLVYTSSSNQKLLIGTKQNSIASLVINSNAVNINETVNVVGDINFTGSLRQNGALFQSGGGGGSGSSVGWSSNATLNTVFTFSNIVIGASNGTNPTSKLSIVGTGPALHINNNTASGTYIDINNSNTALTENVRFLAGVDGNGYSGTNGQASLSTWTNHPLVFFTNMAERMRITNTGNVGIGTSTPGTLVHVAGNGTFSNIGIGRIPTAALDINVGTNSNFQAFNFRGQDGYGIYAQSDHISSRGNTLRIMAHDYNNNVITNRDLLTFRPEGNIGIGTSNPNSAYRLDVSGAARISSNLDIGLDGTPGIIRFGGPAGDTPFNYAVIANRLYGATDQSELVIFKGNDTTPSGPDRIRLRAAELVFDTYPSGSEDFTASNPRMIISSSGQVGIGTTTPTASSVLHVNSGRVFIGDAGKETTSASITGANALSNMLIFDNWFDGNRTINASTPANKIRLHTGVNNNWIAGFGISGDALNYHIGTTGNHVFWTGSTSSNYGTERMRITDNGLVDVNGSVLLRHGNNNVGTSSNQILFGYQNTSTYMHSIKTRHNAAYNDAGNAIDFCIWQVSDGVNGIGSKQMMTITSSGIGIGNTTSPGHALDVIGTIRASQDVIAFSDSNYKCNIELLTDSMEKIKALNGYTFNFKTNLEKRHVGVLAQEVENVLPEAVYTDAENGKKSVAYGNMIALLIEGMKTLEQQIQELKKRNASSN